MLLCDTVNMYCGRYDYVQNGAFSEGRNYVQNGVFFEGQNYVQNERMCDYYVIQNHVRFCKNQDY